MACPDEPKPGTYGALTRSTEPFPWRRLADRASFTPQQLLAHLLDPGHPFRELREYQMQDDLQKLLGPLQAADPSEFQNHRDPTWPSLDETLQWEPSGLPTWWALRQGSPAALLRNLRESLPTSLTTPKTSDERQQVVDSLRRIYGGLSSGASDILSS